MFLRPYRNGLAAALFILTFTVFLPVRQASAHAHLVEQSPIENSVTPPPNQLALTFSEGIEMNFSRFVLTDVRGQPVLTGNPVAASEDQTRIIVPLISSLQPGEYRVEWSVVSVDGHKTQGSYVFRVQ